MNLTAKYWKEFQIQNPAYQNIDEPNAFYFCAAKIDLQYLTLQIPIGVDWF